jgi:hypothetical protein
MGHIVRLALGMVITLAIVISGSIGDAIVTGATGCLNFPQDTTTTRIDPNRGIAVNSGGYWDSSTVRKLRNETFDTGLSPDGHSVGIVKNGEAGVYVARSKGWAFDTPRLLLRDPVPLHVPLPSLWWSPDNQWLTVLEQAQGEFTFLSIITMDGVVHFESGPAMDIGVHGWTADNAYFVFSTDNPPPYSIKIWSRATGNITDIGFDAMNYLDVTFSPLGHDLVISTPVGDSAASLIVYTPGLGVRGVFTVPGTIHPLVEWSPDGQYFTTAWPDSGGNDVSHSGLYGLDGLSITELDEAYSVDPLWTGNGHHLVYLQGKSSTQRINSLVAIDPSDMAKQTVLVQGLSNTIPYLRWPLNTRDMIVVFPRDPAQNRIVDTLTGQARFLPPDAATDLATLSPGGHLLAGFTTNTAALRLLNLDTGTVQSIPVTLPPVEIRAFATLDWSPDGSQMAVSYGTADTSPASIILVGRDGVVRKRFTVPYKYFDIGSSGRAIWSACGG